MRKFLFVICIGLAGIFSAEISAQTPAASPAPALSGIKANLAVGEITAVSQSDNKISLQTSDGAIDVVLSPTTVFKRISPANPNLQQATASSVSEVGIGDKILVTGAVAADKKTIPAKSVFIMTKADIAKRDTSEREMWRTRGISGKVVAVDFKTRQVTLATRGMMGETNVTLTPKENASYRRYAPDSEKYSDAKSSSLAEIKTGDQIRALGDKSEDGTSFKAEQIISGSFKQVVGTITAVDAAKNEITIKEFQTDKPITIIVKNTSVLKKFPEEMAGFMAMRGQGGGMNPQSGGQPGGNANRPTQKPEQPPTEGQRPGGGMRQGGGMRGGRGDLDAMLERLPTITIADLKVGDAIGVSSTASGSDRVTAIKLLSGIQAFLQAPQVGGGRGTGRGGQGVSIDIPGLDGGFGEP